MRATIHVTWFILAILTLILRHDHALVCDDGSSLSPILIGASLDIDGRKRSESAGVLAGYRSWERWTNEHGGIMYQGVRRQARLVIMDDRGISL